MKLSLSLEIGRNGRCMAWCAEFPGAHVSLPSEQETLGAMPSEIRSFIYFLRHCGEDVTPPRSISFSIVERQVFGNKLAPGDTQAFFSSDAIPLTKTEEKRYLRRLACSRAMLLDLLGNLPQEAWMWKKEGRPGRAMGKMGGGWDLSTYLSHIASAEKWYLTNFWGNLPRLRRTDDRIERITLVREQLLECFSGTTKGDRERIVDPEGEPWSLRKVLRRAIYHERFHSRGIALLFLGNGRKVSKQIREGLGV